MAPPGAGRMQTMHPAPPRIPEPRAPVHHPVRHSLGDGGSLGGGGSTSICQRTTRPVAPKRSEGGRPRWGAGCRPRPCGPDQLTDPIYIPARKGQELFSLFSRPGDSLGRRLKNPPGEGTGPTGGGRDFRVNHVGRVPSRGVPRIFQQAVWAGFLPT
jgi:hypothetical protein